jgi:hypothetical protein
MALERRVPWLRVACLVWPALRVGMGHGCSNRVGAESNGAGWTKLRRYVEVQRRGYGSTRGPGLLQTLASGRLGNALRARPCADVGGAPDRGSPLGPGR